MNGWYQTKDARTGVDVVINLDAVIAIFKAANGNAKFDIPVTVPLVVNFGFSEPQSVIGSCRVTRDEIGLSIDGAIYDGIDIPKEGYIGGYYNQVCRDVDVIRSATLRAVSIVSNPCDWECKYKTEDK
jgi:hypothetical protein